MTAEQQLYEALVRFLAERGQELSNQPLDDLIVPLSSGQLLRVPVVFLNSHG